MFTTLISWMDYSKYQYVFLEDNLIILSQVRNRIQFRPPSGKLNKDVLKQVLYLAKKEGADPPFGLIDLETKNFISKNFPKLVFSEDRDYFDYVYLSSDLAELAGSDFSKIRNRLNKFKKIYSYSLETVCEENFEEVKKFLKRWCLWKDCESNPLLENEKNAILYSMSKFFELELSCIAIRIDGDIEAIAVYEQMSPDTVVVHYEKGSPDFDGIYKVVNQETAKIVQKDFKFINRESDMGITGLRKAKMSYRPHHMVEVFHVDRQNMNI